MKNSDKPYAMACEYCHSGPFQFGDGSYVVCSNSECIVGSSSIEITKWNTLMQRVKSEYGTTERQQK